MTEIENNDRKRSTFLASDTELLIDCVIKHQDVLQRDGLKIDIKRKVWNIILEEYNAAQTGGIRTLEELKRKYKNEKYLAKKNSMSFGEIRKTGSSPKLKDDGDFELSQPIAGFSTSVGEDIRMNEEFLEESHEQEDTERFEEESETFEYNNTSDPLSIRQQLDRKRLIFIPSDVDLLMDCVKKHAKVFENHQPNAMSVNMRRKAWNEIHEKYNAAQTGGIRTLEELRRKYKNEKYLAKKNLVNFNEEFSQEYHKQEDTEEEEYNKTSDPFSSTAQAIKRKSSDWKNSFWDAKLKCILLENEYKQELIEKVRLEKRKLQLEIQKLEREK